jgi:hypothetical protein
MAPYGLFLPVGLNAGAAIHPGDGTGFLWGGEVSFASMQRGPIWGGYVDMLHDGESHCWRLTVGPEVALALGIGFDAGLVVDGLGGDETRLGARVRYFAAFPFVMPYVAETFSFAKGAGTPVTEAGVLLKFPIPLTSN